MNNRCTLIFRHVEFTRWKIQFSRWQSRIVWATTGTEAYRYALYTLHIEPLRVSAADHPLESWKLSNYGAYPN